MRSSAGGIQSQFTALRGSPLAASASATRPPVPRSPVVMRAAVRSKLSGDDAPPVELKRMLFA